MKYSRTGVKIDRKERDRRFREFADAFQRAARNKTVLIEFFEDLFTPKELEEFATRWQIVKLLSKNVPQHQIAAELHTAIATVTRGAREWSGERGGFRKVLDLGR